jgi:hypothetical protein
MLIKIYGKEADKDARYTPPKCIGTEHGAKWSDASDEGGRG